MYLKEIFIHGFKSFADKIELNFGDGITAVVGPNGSGKSNISDAIRWVLGEQSVKSLRGNKMEDVIFSGSDKKKGLSFAEVLLCIDNSDKLIPVDYSEINVMRKMYRSGESEYFINKVQCRLKDIYELFMDTGIGKDGYSIIGQGRIDEILSNKSEDRRLVFEEAAGIVKYKTRKFETEKKLQATNLNITRVQDILKEIELQMEPLSEQAEVAKRYIIIAEELKSLEINLFLNNIVKTKDKLEKIKFEATGISELLKDKVNFSKELDIAHDKLKSELIILEVRVGQHINKIHSLENDEQKYYGEYNLAKQKIDNIDDSLIKIDDQLKEYETESQKEKNQFSEKEEQHKQINTELLKLNGELVKLEDQFEIKYNSVYVMEQDLSVKQQELINNINNISELRSRTNSLASFSDTIKKRNKQLKEDVLSFEQQLENKKSLATSIKVEAEECKSKINNQIVEFNVLNDSKIRCENSILEYENKISKIRSEKDSLSSRLKVLEEIEKDFGGYSKSVKSLLQEGKSLNIAKSFLGVVGEVILVPSTYVTAIEVALGASVQSIITGNEEDAKQLIEYLKKNKLGRATFLPMNSVKPRFFNEREKQLLNVDGFVGVAADIISYDKKFSNVMHNILGRIAVAKDMDSSIKIARLSDYGFKIVSLDGEIINSGGSITGGSLNITTNSVLSRKNEINMLKDNYEKTKLDFDRLIQDLSKNKQNISKIIVELSLKTDLIHSLKIELNNINNRFQNIQNEMELFKERIAINQKEVEELENQKQETTSEIEINSLKVKQAELEKEDLEKGILSLQSVMKEVKEASEKENIDITHYKVKIASLVQNEQSMEQTLIISRESIKELEKKISECNKHLIDLNKEKEEKVTSLAIKDNEIMELKEELKIKQEMLKIDEEKKEKIQVNIEKIDIQLKEIGNEVLSNQNYSYKTEMQQAKFELELENNEFKLLETYDMNYNKATEYFDETINLLWASKRCEELKNETREMGFINVNSIEEYAKQCERQRFLNTQIEDLIGAKETLNKIITEITEKMKQQFVTEFHKINKSFGDVFEQLFGGGHAELIISDEENVLESGIEIIAKPPGKKQQNLSLLSGGERALTAIALLFGILKLKPAPFCVLDEIDAALDDANVDRYAKFLKQFSNTTQFIIITHRKSTMEAANTLYGVSMEQSGVSKIVSVKLEERAS